MEGNARPRFTPRQRAELWERWRNGQCIADIARALERRNKSGVYRVLALNGGITPAARRRGPVALRLEEREEISRGIAAGRSIRRIAQGLGRSPSTVSREARRNGGCTAYRASDADTRAWDRGKEMAEHKAFTFATNVRVYFCDPRSPRQRGSNENTNGLLCQYFPKGTDLSGYSQAYLNKIALRLNHRPRKTLGFETPADTLRAVLQ